MEHKEHNTEDSSVTKLLLEIVQSEKRANSNTTKLFLITVVMYTIVLVSMIFGFILYESQFEIKSQTTEETIVTQKVSGEDSEINNVHGNLYKDKAVHNQGKEGDSDASTTDSNQEGNNN